MSGDLLDRLNAALDERERLALAATAGPWGYNPGKQWHDGEDFVTLTNPQEYVSYGGPSPFTGCVALTGDANDAQSMADAAFIAANDPTHVLREIAFHRYMAGHLARELADDPTQEVVQEMLDLLVAVYLPNETIGRDPEEPR